MAENSFRGAVSWGWFHTRFHGCFIPPTPPLRFYTRFHTWFHTHLERIRFHTRFHTLLLARFHSNPPSAPQNDSEINVLDVAVCKVKSM